MPEPKHDSVSEPVPPEDEARPAYLIALQLDGARCVVVGGGTVAARRIATLLESGARVEVISPEADPTVRALAVAGRITWQAREYEAGDLAGARLALAATDDPAMNQQVAEDARAAGIWVNVADGSAHGDFSIPATLRRGALALAVATGGGAPGYARRLRAQLERVIGPEYGVALALYARARPAILAAASERQPGLWDALFALDLPGVIRARGEAEGEHTLSEWLDHQGLA